MNIIKFVVKPDSPTFGTTSVQLSERKNGFLTPKRHQIKHLEFVIAWFGTRGSQKPLPGYPLFCLCQPRASVAANGDFPFQPPWPPPGAGRGAKKPKSTALSITYRWPFAPLPPYTLTSGAD
jgi:hypothetical protein